jgi:hypothetical protein
MTKLRIDEETGRVLFASVAVWAAVIASAAAENVFGKFDASSEAAFAALVAAYALAAYHIDREVHAYIVRFSRARIFGAALLALGAIALGALTHTIPLTVFAAPFAAVACAASIERMLPPKVRKSRAKSPAATPAAT